MVSKKVLRYFSWIIRFIFNIGAGGYSGHSASAGFPGCGNHVGVFPIIFVLNLNRLPFEALLSTLTILSL